MTKPEDIVTDDQIDAVWGNANFGPGLTRRQIVNQAVLKCAAGFYQGYTSHLIAFELGLIADDASKEKYHLTAKGKSYLWAAFKSNPSV